MLALLLLLWPWPRVEKGVVHLGKDGTAIVGFKPFFKKIPKCTADNGAKFRVTSREHAEIVGQPEARISWSCK
jgi:hypothetical protein